MKNSKKSFQVLVSKMEPLTENQEGKLKGGFASAFQLSTMQTSLLGTNSDKCKNRDCTITNYGCTPG
ncbi:MAG: hypothetical protein A3K10_15970 [Bacteroidetes bacterium RIFCSPLOWO2_12_FULL_31_6]|nr:MAG: hypothetical protein A3K10_15970 [Bacteroidetes bacterium RIFCSPLOWO2_12_FULL_31_6]